MIFKKAAELEKFFEKDIIEFLDRNLALKGAQTEIKELEDAVQKKDYDEAGRIIEETVENFNHTDVKDVYREVNFNRLLELVRVAHNYADVLTERNRLVENLDLLEKSGELNQDATNNINVFEERKLKEIREKEEQIRKDKDLARQLETENVEINKILFESIRQKDVKKAISYYKKLRSNFEKYPNSLKEQKTEFFNDLIAFYMRIKKIRSEILEQQDEEDAQITINKEDRDKAREINDQVPEINKALVVSLRKKDLKSAILNYRKLKKCFEEYPITFIAEKKEFYNDVISFYNKINKLKEEIFDHKTEQKTSLKMEQKTQENKLKLEDIKNYVAQIKKFTEEKNFVEAKLNVLNFKHRINMIPEKYINIKNILNNVADQLIQKIEFSKKLNGKN